MKQTYDEKTDIVLCNGDYNIPYTKMPMNFRTALIDSNKDFEKCCDQLDVEYDEVLK